MPEDSVVLALDQWEALGQPRTTEGFHAALQRIQDRRRRARFELTLQVRISRLDAHGKYLDQEITSTKDLSEGGMMVSTSLPLKNGETIVVREEDGPFRSHAEVLEIVPAGEGDVVWARLRLIDRDAGNYIRRMLYATSHR
jgi:hypothetical protein